MELRESVRRFAEEMEKVLRANDHKEGWEELTNDCLIESLEEELNELHNLFYHREAHLDPSDTYPEIDLKAVVHEAIDVANFAMMLYDNNSDHYHKTEECK